MAKRKKRVKRKRRSYYYEAPWEPGGVYHVYSSAVEPNRLFGHPDHYQFFVELLRDRIACFAEIFAYALLINHFHVAVRLPSEAWLRTDILSRPPDERTAKEEGWLRGEVPYRQLIGDYWNALTSVYARYYNPKAKRRGTLLNRPLRRIRVREDLISRRLIMYVHTNEVKHGVRTTYHQANLRSSFAYYRLERPDHWLARAAVLERFGGLEAFYRRHDAYVRKYGTQISTFDEQLYFAPTVDIPEESPYVEFLEDAPPPNRI